MRIYGKEFDINDEDHLILAVYFLALGKARSDYNKELESMMDVFGE